MPKLGTRSANLRAAEGSFALPRRHDLSHSLSSFPRIPFPSTRESALYLTTNTNCTSLQKATFEKKTPFCGFISCRTKFSQIFLKTSSLLKKVQNATSCAREALFSAALPATGLCSHVERRTASRKKERFSEMNFLGNHLEFHGITGKSQT